MWGMAAITTDDVIKATNETGLIYCTFHRCLFYLLQFKGVACCFLVPGSKYLSVWEAKGITGCALRRERADTMSWLAEQSVGRNEMTGILVFRTICWIKKNTFKDLLLPILCEFLVLP